MSTYQPHWIAKIVASLIYPIALPGWALESLLRRVSGDPGYHFRYRAGVFYGLATTALASLFIVYGRGLHTVIGSYILIAWQLLAVWVCLCIAVGRKSKLRAWLRELARRPAKPGPFRFSPKWIYLVLAAYIYTIFFFACAYYVVGEIEPGCLPVKNGQGFLRLFEYAYFSTVTIATVGYGDMTPLTVLPRLVAMIEIVTGVFFQVFIFGMLLSFQFSKATEAALERRLNERNSKDED